MDAVEGRHASTDHAEVPEGLTLSWVDPRDEEEFAAWFAVMDEAARHGREDPLVWEPADLRAHLLDDDEDEDHLIAAARLDGRVVGVGSIDIPLRENLDSASLDVNVPPASRGRGIGSAVLAFLESEASSRGRSRLEGETVVVGGGPREESAGVRFGSRHGFVVANTEDHLVLALPTEVRETGRLATGYVLVDWQDRAPEEYAEAYARMRSALSADVPRGELAREPEVWDVERLRGSEQRSLNQGRATLVSAVVAPDGDVVGHTTLTVPADGDEVYQGDTYVMTAHRGKGLGRALKERNLARLSAIRPGRGGSVHTWTADVNAPMIAINQALGFRVAEVTCELERRREPASD